MSEPPASLMYSCTRMLASSCRKAAMTDSAAFFVSASTTPTPWVPSSSFTITGAPPTVSSRPSMSLVEWAKAVTGRPMPDAGQQLQAAELVAAPGDRLALVGRERAHQLELAHDGRAVERVAGADAGDDGVEALELAALELHGGAPAGDVQVAAQVVDDLRLVAARLGRLPQAGGGVERRVAGEDGDLQARRRTLRVAGARGESPPPRNDRPGSTRKRRRSAGAAEQHPEAHLVAVGERELDRHACSPTATARGAIAGRRSTLAVRRCGPRAGRPAAPAPAR